MQGFHHNKEESMISQEAHEAALSQIEFMTWLTEEQKASRVEFMEYVRDMSWGIDYMGKLLRSADDTPKQPNMENVADETRN